MTPEPFPALNCVCSVRVVTSSHWTTSIVYAIAFVQKQPTLNVAPPPKEPSSQNGDQRNPVPPFKKSIFSFRKGPSPYDKSGSEELMKQACRIRIFEPVPQ
ncbi:hypothetical protein AVEN_115054-1 [Araneus ventricosus]|uniref:Uncharacterized protein n=1 Tax=Araneus ventricosus TaxID=182803 RepID=A0A4Y1ZY94_ARAVE|nr:hypothetical protein AVEN_115054-1 [Araneus ventricosus]